MFLPVPFHSSLQDLDERFVEGQIFNRGDELSSKENSSSLSLTAEEAMDTDSEDHFMDLEEPFE